MMGDDDEAKDVLQDTFIDAFMKIDTLKNPEMLPRRNHRRPCGPDRDRKSAQNKRLKGMA